LGALALSGAAVFWLIESRKGPAVPLAPGPEALHQIAAPAAPTAVAPEQFLARYAGSASCRDCHKEAYERWEGSHHARAERGFDLAEDLPVFYPPRQFQHGTQTSEVRYARQRFELRTLGWEGERGPYVLERVIGEAPLRQYLVARPGGRYQVTEVAADPRQRDWFNIFGDEDRRPGEWGHWTGRGMTWNSMCAVCHNTGLLKNYQAATDVYDTRWVEAGVGCEACHGPMADHVTWQRQQPQQPPLIKDPTLRPLTKDQMLDACGMCHARRSELTGRFQPGDSFFDHHGLVIPDETDLYYPDGQVRDEDYEYASFLSSRMFLAGVRCGDCHEPHSSKPFTLDNGLCLRCHSAPVPPAPKIDAAQHSFHKPGTSGDLCMDCHMPQTVYMQRHWRHDHGFTIPDPLLTRQHAIPNACNRCHKDKSVDWAIEAVEKWYGPRMERATRTRAQWLARARAGDRTAAAPLARLAAEEPIPLWRAVSVGLLKPWVSEELVRRAVLDRTRDEAPLVRAVAARTLEPYAGTGHAATDQALRGLLEDPVRWVRFEAAWALRATLDTNSVPGRDLLTYLDHNSDQPSGLLQRGVLEFDRGQTETAIGSFRRAVSWDGRSAPLRQALAVALSASGRGAEAVQELEVACQLAPREAGYRFRLGLALNEVGQLPRALRLLAEAVQLDPQFAQAWYNLGLAHSASGDAESALEALVRAESVDSHSPQIPYARATVLARLGRDVEARQAVRRTLELDPRHAEARQLLEWLQRR